MSTSCSVWQQRELTYGPSDGLTPPDQPSRRFMKNLLVSLLISYQWGNLDLTSRGAWEKWWNRGWSFWLVLGNYQCHRPRKMRCGAKWVNSISDLFGLSEGHSVGCQKVVGNMALSLRKQKIKKCGSNVFYKAFLYKLCHFPCCPNSPSSTSQIAPSALFPYDPEEKIKQSKQE